VDQGSWYSFFHWRRRTSPFGFFEAFPLRLCARLLGEPLDAPFSPFHFASLVQERTSEGSLADLFLFLYGSSAPRYPAEVRPPFWPIFISSFPPLRLFVFSIPPSRPRSRHSTPCSRHGIPTIPKLHGSSPSLVGIRSLLREKARSPLGGGLG